MNRIPARIPISRTVHVTVSQGDHMGWEPETWTIRLERTATASRKWVAIQQGLEKALALLREKREGILE